ncbi:Rop family plasmid primer RNA-binding protein [Pantoea agglomerans]|uniref:Rop family plasmid primer RNA-binding protein n=1 Tax=Pantoea TaxID=53335 RepID=UPI003D2A5152
MHQNDWLTLSHEIYNVRGKTWMKKQEPTALSMAKFIRGQTLLLLEKLDAPDLNDEAADYEELHEQA